MNPWMQNVWSDLHTVLIGYLRDTLSATLPNDLMARAEENVTLSSPMEADHIRVADVGIVESESWKSGRRPVWTPEDDPELTGRMAAPIKVETEMVTPRWVEILSDKGQLITVIEVTSPSNKTASGRREFEKRINRFLSGGVNVMEIDLLRGGYAAKDFRGGRWPPATYCIFAIRPDQPTIVEAYPCQLREPLPAVRVPLRQLEPDAGLDLQPLINRCYTNGRYWMLPYPEDPRPPLADEDLIWARERLKEAGLAA